jgi:hypothetical protein
MEKCAMALCNLGFIMDLCFWKSDLPEQLLVKVCISSFKETYLTVLSADVRSRETLFTYFAPDILRITNICVTNDILTSQKLASYRGM